MSNAKAISATHDRQAPEDLRVNARHRHERPRVWRAEAAQLQAVLDHEREQEPAEELA
jgi:hypothetical protein